MTLKEYLLAMIATTLVCWGIFAFVVNSVNPDKTNWVGFILFYASIFLATTGTAAIIGFVIRFIGLKKELAFYSVKEAFRQSFLFGFFVISVLLLLSRGLFSWLNLFLLVVALSVLEYLLLSFSTKRPKITQPDYTEDQKEVL